MTSCDNAYATVRTQVEAAAQRAGHAVQLLAVSKTRPAAAIRELAEQGQLAFGENYVQEALAKQPQLASLALQWHLIGPLQSNKCREAALHFDWLHSLDRAKLIAPLARFRPDAMSPLNVLIQVNIDDESSKSGCSPELVPVLADEISRHPTLRLRGLMAIPAPHAQDDLRRAAFRHMFVLQQRLRETHAHVDTLSMGMSEDFALAIAEGATMVRIGSAIFGKRT